MTSFYLEILTPERVFYKGDCISLMVPITDGILGIMANREPVTASLTGGEASFTDPSMKKTLFSISGGMIDVQDNRVTLLCDYALLPEEINTEKEEEQAYLARKALSEKQSRRDYLVSKLILNNAINNLRVKEKHTLN